MLVRPSTPKARETRQTHTGCGANLKWRCVHTFVLSIRGVEIAAFFQAHDRLTGRRVVSRKSKRFAAQAATVASSLPASYFTMTCSGTLTPICGSMTVRPVSLNAWTVTKYLPGLSPCFATSRNRPLVIFPPALWPSPPGVGWNVMAPFANGLPSSVTVPLASIRPSDEQPTDASNRIANAASRARIVAWEAFQKSLGITSPPAGVARICHVRKFTVSLTNRVLPSQIAQTTPPGCALREV